LTNITPLQLATFIQQKSINQNIEEALRRVLAQKAVVEETDGQKDAREEEMTRIFDDQERLRENMKALKGSAEEKALVQRYARQLDDEENRLEALRRESAQLEQKLAAAQATLNRMIEELSFDTEL
jgi:hypothetical protein